MCIHKRETFVVEVTSSSLVAYIKSRRMAALLIAAIDHLLSVKGLRMIDYDLRLNMNRVAQRIVGSFHHRFAERGVGMDVAGNFFRRQFLIMGQR